MKTRTTVFVMFLIIFIMTTLRLWIYPTYRITTTELLHQFKNYVVVDKYETKNNYYIVVKNPHMFLFLKPLNIPSGVYYNFYVGDTIGTKKQTYFN